MEQLRSTNDIVEIASLLKEIQGNAHKLLVWQNMGENEHRVVCEARLSKVNLGTSSIVLMPFSLEVNFDFDRKLTLYLRTNHKSVLFKTEAPVITSQKIVLGIPRDMKVVEYRKYPRMVFDENISFKANLSKKYGTSRINMEVNILDLGKMGLALKLSHLNVGKFSEGDTIQLSGFGGSGEDLKVEGEIVYIEKLPIDRRKGQQNFRVGVKFFRELEDSFIRSISS